MNNELLVYEILKDAAVKWPGKPAVYDDHGMMTFAELYSQTEILRIKLIELGVKPGMGMGVKARNGRNFIMGIFAGVGCGAAVMPMSHQLKTAEIDEILAEAQLHVIIDDMSGVCPVKGVGSVIEMNAESFSFIFTGKGQLLPYAPHVHLPAFIRFTSGTTGKSKGVIVSHQSVIERIEGANKALSLGTEDTVVRVLRMAYHFIV